MRMKSRQAYKILKAFSKANYKSHISGDLPIYRHSGAQWLRATFVMNKHQNVPTEGWLDDGSGAKTMGGHANHHLCESIRRFGFYGKKREVSEE